MATIRCPCCQCMVLLEQLKPHFRQCKCGGGLHLSVSPGEAGTFSDQDLVDLGLKTLRPETLVGETVVLKATGP